MEKGHGREEMQTYPLLPSPEKLPGFTRWKGLKSIAMATSHCLRDALETIEVHYYVSSLTVDAKRFARTIRGYRGIENCATGVRTRRFARTSHGSASRICTRTSRG